MNYTIPKDIIITELDDNEAVLLDLKSERYYSLNETGLLIYKGIEVSLTLEKNIEQLISIYDLDKAEALDSVNTLISKLLNSKLIEKA
ncbi:MAG: PqqD family protein [Deltaproteobacteria bacterium]|nr:PqqD family protein [Deltaproteobacteria bacterium]MCL5792638.1 PqqD family protein [Deltaproteobacteria bacterium]